jgi:D-arabinose 1-dehydrogenase-like Zn-dependent alcohol dehydrogenase
MRSLIRALKPGGRVVLVEYRGEDPAVSIKFSQVRLSDRSGSKSINGQIADVSRPSVRTAQF